MYREKYTGLRGHTRLRAGAAFWKAMSPMGAGHTRLRAGTARIMTFWPLRH